MARRRAGGLESEVLAVLAASAEAMTPAEVLTELGSGLAYTTVMTALSRLHEKGAVTRERSGRAYAYRWAADGATLTARQMRRLLEHGTDRGSVLARFVAELDPADEQLLAELLAEPPERAAEPPGHA